MIPYRGLTKEGKRVYGYLFKSWEEAYILWGTTNGIPDMIEVIPETVGQSTGLQDKNGKDLDWWEGDLFMMHGHSIPWVIVKEQGCFWFKCPVTKERKLCYRVAEYFNQPVKVGDVHSTPELLETKNGT